ncbi:7749_t:CDS:2 [Rhizophagus irregularis]|nr:7749_t:CDS:2 [Rhizophagus irregularis]
MKLLPLNRNQINTNEFLNRLWIRYFLLLRISFLSFRSYVDAISENKEHDRKHRKLDHLIDLAGDGSGVAGGKITFKYLIIEAIFIYQSYFYKQTMKELVHFFGDSVLKSRTHSQLGSTIIFTGVTADWNVARSLYSIADIQSCIDKVRPVRFGEHLNLYELEVDGAYGLDYCNWMIDCGGEKISIVSSSSMVQNIHPLPFDETVFSNADVLTFLSLKFGPGFLSQHLRAVGLRGIPFYAVSPIAEESLKYSNICGECSLQEKYQEPCVVFAVHLSLRSGAAINSLDSGEIIQAIQ